MRQGHLSGQVSVVGAATAGIGWDTRNSVSEIMAEAANNALDDAGLRVADVDGLFAVTPYYWMPSATLADQLGIQPKVTDSTNIGGASVLFAVAVAPLWVLSRTALRRDRGVTIGLNG